MSSFTDYPAMQPLEDGRKWRLLSSFEFHVGSYPSEEIIRVPSGFVTDFASVPQILWNIFPPTGKYGKATILHDFLYVVGGYVPLIKDGEIVYKWYTKKDADEIFLECMKILEVGKIRRRLMFWAVRIGGRGNFEKVRNELNK